ncbi:MAG TPA: TadE/TadG family type IV pilus assembly protein [Anaerolineae bacterium]|nr:TadE/TadG family type IV pilus assembly protein [Anaerolineae bacterium]HQH37043.1 TadE/TadG family type IV pilus assembly protein [Anaerolineae bacterium]
MKNKRENGQSVIEFALTLPLLILMLMGLLDFGRAYFIVVMLNDAAAEGAVYAGACPTDVDGIQLRVTEAASDNLIQIEPADVTVLGSVIAAGESITVSVRYEFTFLTPLVNEMFGDGLTLRGQAINPIIDGS